MSKGKIDLHVHSIYSDGTLTPRELLEEAKLQGVTTIAITDHDCCNGVEETINQAVDFGISVIPGVEITANVGFQQFHILGYHIDYKSELWNKYTDEIRAIKMNQIKSICNKLNILGYGISRKDIEEEIKFKSLGIYIVSFALMKTGYVKSVEEGNKILLSQCKEECSSYEAISPINAIKLITRCNGIPVLAHPYISKNIKYVREFKEHGLRGIEVFYPKHNSQQIIELKNLAKNERLIMTGGSDFHGPLGPHCEENIKMGSTEVSYNDIKQFEKYIMK
ncbi:MAG: PHP domain-containing protein [Clostridiaceae bacterium]